MGVAGHVWQLHKSDFSNGESHEEGVVGFIGHFSSEIIPVDLSQGGVEMWYYPDFVDFAYFVSAKQKKQKNMLNV